MQILFAGFIGVGDAKLADLFLHQRIAGKKISGSAILLKRSIVEMEGIGSEKRHLGLRCNTDGGQGTGNRGWVNRLGWGITNLGRRRQSTRLLTTVVVHL
ncbi:hypothetical protein B723_25220 [Pseudomonas fluorescens NCIMB 11764]|uniref:Uncharacterized protein n=1 Tax=Pseudomonas fluorescens NCIMB 11764 TaxID=1221522 RepID=A0A0K1QVM6_PSEFL|nr:hypothetical protein B723_25220 [Pseudomonas fluorescens NCIMB 11764]